jgi:hypothetical protein
VAQSDDLWVVDRNSNLVNFRYVISLFIGADSNNGSLFTVHVNAFDPAGTFAGNAVAELTSHTDATGMTEADAVVLLQELAVLLGIWAPGPAVGAGY